MSATVMVYVTQQRKLAHDYENITIPFLNLELTKYKSALRHYHIEQF